VGCEIIDGPLDGETVTETFDLRYKKLVIQCTGFVEVYAGALERIQGAQVAVIVVQQEHRTVELVRDSAG
jgi:hypothetical protein